MTIFRDIFTLSVRLCGLIFLCSAFINVTPLFDIGTLRMAMRNDIFTLALPVVFKLVLAFWLMSNQWLVRIAYPQKYHKPALENAPGKTKPIESPDQRLSHLVKSVLLIFLCGNATATPFTWTVVSDTHAAAPASHYGSWDNPRTTTSNDWAQYRLWIPFHTNDGVFNVGGEIYPGDLYEQAQDVATVMSLSNAFLNPLVTTNWVNPLDVFSYISNQIHSGLFEFAANGNHDADDTNTLRLYANTTFCNSNSLWNIWLGTNVFGRSPYFEGTRFANDTRQMCMLYTNQGLKFVICSIQWCTNPIVLDPNAIPPSIDIVNSYTDQVAWVKSKWQQYPDHLGVLVDHWSLNWRGQFDNEDTGPYGGGTYTNIGPSQATMMLATCTNAFLIISGHNRGTLSKHQILLVPGNPSHWMLIVNWDTQAFSPFVQMFDCLTFSPDTMRLYVNAYDITKGRFMTNGETRAVWQGNSLTWTNGTPLPFNYSYSVPIPNLNSGWKSVFRLQ